VEQLAAIVSETLEQAGITATLSGGAAVTIYADNEYLSGGLDFVTNARMAEIEEVRSIRPSSNGCVCVPRAASAAAALARLPRRMSKCNEPVGCGGRGSNGESEVA